MKRLCVVTAIACLIVLPMSARTRFSSQGARPTPDISGFWELSFDSRNVPRANLLPTVTRARLDAHAKKDAYAIRWCNLLGMPFVMDPGRPLDIRQGSTRDYYRRRRTRRRRATCIPNRSAHISDDIFDPSTNGDSIAHWEGDTLVVDTVGSTASTESPPYRAVVTARRNRGWSSDIGC